MEQVPYETFWVLPLFCGPSSVRVPKIKCQYKIIETDLLSPSASQFTPLHIPQFYPKYHSLTSHAVHHQNVVYAYCFTVPEIGPISLVFRSQNTVTEGRDWLLSEKVLKPSPARIFKHRTRGQICLSLKRLWKKYLRAKRRGIYWSFVNSRRHSTRRSFVPP